MCCIGVQMTKSARFHPNVSLVWYEIVQRKWYPICVHRVFAPTDALLGCSLQKGRVLRLAYQ